MDDSDDDDGAESSAGTGAEPAIAIDDDQIDFDHHYDIENDWSSDCDCFTEGQSVYYYHAPNLGGAAGVAALQTRWGNLALLKGEFHQPRLMASTCTRSHRPMAGLLVVFLSGS